MQVHTCFMAPAIGVLLLSVAASVRATPDTYYYEGQFHLPIPAAPGATKGWMTDAVLDVPDHVAIADLDVTITLTHTNVFDLQLFLQSPSGTRVLLNMYDPFTGYFNGDDYDHTIFDDEAAVAIQEGLPPFAGRFRPLIPGTLSSFDGQDAYGPWRLQIYDAFYADTGQLDTFGLFITTTPTIPVPTALVLAVIGLGLVRRPR